jgi:hypothetical protein
MPYYKCPRCKYETNKRSNIVNHYNRKRPCKTIYSDISLELLSRNISNSIISNDDHSDTSSSKKYSQNIAKYSFKPKKNIAKYSRNIAENSFELNLNRYICRYCKKEFKHQSSKSRHELKVCKKSLITNANKTELVTELFSQLNEERSEKKELIDQINKLIDKTGNTTINTINNISNTQNNQTNQTNQNNQNNIIHNNHTENATIRDLNRSVKLRDYGDENMEHITHDFCKELLKEPYSGPNKLVRAIHFNPDYRENNNMQATNRKSNITTIVRNGKWEYMNKKTLLNKEFIKTNKILDDCFNKEKDNLDKEFVDLYERFKIARYDLHQYNNTLCNIFIEILNGTNETKILNSHKNMELLNL